MDIYIIIYIFRYINNYPGIASLLVLIFAGN